MKERDMQTKFNKYCRHNIKETSVFELKITKTKSLSFSAVKPHQIHGLQVAQKKLIYKIEDVGLSTKPFDSFCIAGAKAYVVVMFYTRGCKTFYMITIGSWVNETEVSSRKSLTESRANEIGIKCKLK